MTVKALHNEALIDMVATQTGTIETLFETAIANGQSVDAPLVAGSSVTIVAGTALIRKELGTEVQKTKKTPTVEAFENQNFIDLTLQTKGTMESLFEVCITNDISIDSNPVNGHKYTLPNTQGNPEVVAFYESRGYRPATGIINTNTCIYAECGYVEKGYWE